ncbi:integral membrane protein Mpv17 PMP22 family [Fusarium tjaetaba]|uniref:Integral membrane protein Mpv17 PMP22 family n=1 Tax=Fusarium tjaetaba TaxID=1567544 RepID=A0A8H5W8M5_9HYPO|nr:integral membrane protein Mpv17 PMP22 family [Fusarium tjaetaba]KAF5649293.1 integral membrane protein Mpv17 PMP22 family [Fusarium tjaetaba]
MPSPIVAATLQAAGLSTISNILAQFIEARQQSRPVSLDIVQLLRFVSLTLMTAPPNYQWQGYLERTFPAYPAARGPRLGRLNDLEMQPTEDAPELKEGYEERMAQINKDREPQFSMRNTISKWFVDCITAGAIMNTIAFLIIMGLLKGQGGSQIWSNIKTETIPIIVAGYKIWPVASIISFTFIPVHRRIVFLSFIGLLWGIYMSLVASRV